MPLNTASRTPPPHPRAQSQENVEDTKGNNGESGELTITNLRLTWACRASGRTNLSIGLDCIVQISVRQAASRLRGEPRYRYNNCVSCLAVCHAAGRRCCGVS